MHLVRALVASMGSESLPALERPTVAGYCGVVGTGCGVRRPLRGVKARVTQVFAARGSQGRSSSGAAWGGTQAVKESRPGHRALLFGHVPECGLWQRRIGSWWSPFGVAIKLGESVGRAGCKGLSGEGAGGSGELTEVDEGRCASGPGSDWLCHCVGRSVQV